MITPITKGANNVEDIKIVQMALDLLVLERVIENGHYGAFTDKLVKTFQEKTGLPINGTIDEACWTQIKSIF